MAATQQYSYCQRCRYVQMKEDQYMMYLITRKDVFVILPTDFGKAFTITQDTSSNKYFSKSFQYYQYYVVIKIAATTSNILDAIIIGIYYIEHI